MLKVGRGNKLLPMKHEAKYTTNRNGRIIAELSDKEGFEVKNINSVSEETAQKHQKSWKRI